MIAFWNRREVFLASTQKKMNEVRALLLEKGIDYTYRVVSNFPSRLGPFSTKAFDVAYSKLYYIYVHKKDYELASAAINGRI